MHLVNRLKHEYPDQEIHFLSPVVCMCATMYRIDLAHLCWSLEHLAAGHPVNVIQVDAGTYRLDYRVSPHTTSTDGAVMGTSTNEFTVADGESIEFIPTF